MTFSPCIKIQHPGEAPYWVTNWTQVYDLDNIDWHDLADFVAEGSHRIGFGYVFSKGHNSRNVTSDKNRVVVWEADIED